MMESYTTREEHGNARCLRAPLVMMMSVQAYGKACLGVKRFKT